MTERVEVLNNPDGAVTIRMPVGGTAGVVRNENIGRAEITRKERPTAESFVNRVEELEAEVSALRARLDACTCG